MWSWDTVRLLFHRKGERFYLRTAFACPWKSCPKNHPPIGYITSMAPSPTMAAAILKTCFLCLRCSTASIPRRSPKRSFRNQSLYWRRVTEPIRSIDNRKSNYKEYPYFTEPCTGRSSAIFDCGYRERLSLYCKRQLHQLLPRLRQRSFYWPYSLCPSRLYVDFVRRQYDRWINDKLLNHL